MIRKQRTKRITWEITTQDFDLLVKCAERVERDIPNYPDDRRTLIMDLNACHSNGCPMDFKGLLEANRYEFGHDIYGIRRAVNRRTGRLTEDCFVPRYARPEEVPATTPTTRVGMYYVEGPSDVAFDPENPDWTQFRKYVVVSDTNPDAAESVTVRNGAGQEFPVPFALIDQIASR